QHRMTKSQLLRKNWRGLAKKSCAGELYCTPAERCIRCNRSAEPRFIAGRQGFYNGRGNACGPGGAADRASAWRIARAHRGKQENLVSRGCSDGRRSCTRPGGSRHAVAPLAWDEAERSRARVVAADAPGSGEFRNVRATRGVDRSDYKVARAHL